MYIKKMNYHETSCSTIIFFNTERNNVIQSGSWYQTSKTTVFMSTNQHKSHAFSHYVTANEKKQLFYSQLCNCESLLNGNPSGVF